MFDTVISVIAIQIKICAKYREMLPRPRLVCQEPGLRPIDQFSVRNKRFLFKYYPFLLFSCTLFIKELGKTGKLFFTSRLPDGQPKYFRSCSGLQVYLTNPAEAWLACPGILRRP